MIIKKMPIQNAGEDDDAFNERFMEFLYSYNALEPHEDPTEILLGFDSALKEHGLQLEIVEDCDSTDIPWKIVKL
jgi:hypothetical protein